jgi:hypothetical protein
MVRAATASVVALVTDMLVAGNGAVNTFISNTMCFVDLLAIGKRTISAMVSATGPFPTTVALLDATPEVVKQGQW